MNQSRTDVDSFTTKEYDWFGSSQYLNKRKIDQEGTPALTLYINDCRPRDPRQIRSPVFGIRTDRNPPNPRIHEGRGHAAQRRQQHGYGSETPRFKSEESWRIRLPGCPLMISRQTLKNTG